MGNVDLHGEGMRNRARTGDAREPDSRNLNAREPGWAAGAVPAFGIALWWLWFLAFFFGPVSLPGDTVSQVDAAIGTTLLKVFAMVGYVAASLLALVPRVAAVYREGDVPRLALLCAVQVFAGVLAALCHDLDVPAAKTFVLVGTCVACWGAGTFLLLWVAVFARRGAAVAATLFACGLIAGGVLWVAAASAVSTAPVLGWAIVCAAPVGELVCYARARNLVPGKEPTEERKVRPTPIFLSFGLVYGVLFGFMQAFAPCAQAFGQTGGRNMAPTAVVGVIFAGMATAAFERRPSHAGAAGQAGSSGIDYARALKPLAIVIAAGYAVLAVFGSSGSEGIAIALGIVSFGYLVFWLLYNTVWIDISLRNQANLYSTASWGFVVSALPIALGALLGLAVASRLEGASDVARLGLMADVGVAALLFTLVTYVILMDSRIFADLGGMVTVKERERGARIDGVPESVDVLTARFGMTPREREIALMVARGRNARYIEAQLGISVATVRTHVHHVYEKCGVHSDQELINLVEEETRKREEGVRARGENRRGD